MKTNHTVNIHNNGIQGQKREGRDRERRSCMHTLTHAHHHHHHHHQNGTRDEVKKKRTRRRQTETRKQHTREKIWWKNSEQKIHANILIQVRRFRETKKKKKLWGRQEKNKQTKMIGCFIECVFYDRSCEGTSDESFC